MRSEEPKKVKVQLFPPHTTRQRLKKAAKYAGAGLAVAPPFTAKVSLGESSLEEFLARGGVQWEG